jgi:hypothetical protein
MCFILKEELLPYLGPLLSMCTSKLF